MLKFYYDLASQPCRALYVFLSKTKIPFSGYEIALRKGEHKTPEYKKINPFKLVPVIEDNGFKLTESIAIFRYIIQKHRDVIPDHWYPKDPQDQARVDEYLEWQHLNTRLSCAMYFQYKFLIPLLTQSPPDEEKIEESKSRMEKCLYHFETVWLHNKPYIAGQKISIADIVAIMELQQPAAAGYDVCQNRPVLSEWFKRVSKELQPEFDEGSKVIHLMIDKFGTQSSKL